VKIKPHGVCGDHDKWRTCDLHNKHDLGQENHERRVRPRRCRQIARDYLAFTVSMGNQRLECGTVIFYYFQLVQYMTVLVV
jgi:hypothetical protein